MPRLKPLHWRQVVNAFAKIGYVNSGQKGSHIKLEKPGMARPLIVPRYDEVPVFIIAGLIRTAGITHDEFLTLLP